MENRKAFEEKKQAALEAAREQGIVDIVSGDSDSISLKTVELATRLMKKHGPALHKAIAEERKAQIRSFYEN